MLRTDGTRVTAAAEVPELVAVEKSVVRMAADLLMKVGDGQPVLKKEANMTFQQLRLAYEHNTLTLTPITAAQGEALLSADPAGEDD